MEAPQQYVKGMKDQQTRTCDGLAKSTRSVRGDKRKLRVDPQAAAIQRYIQMKPSRDRPYMRDIVMCEGAKKLSPEEMAALEIDIFKPLDFCGILLERMKESSNGRIISSIHEL